MFRRIRDLGGAVFGIFIRRAEDAVPLEERLRYDRERKGQTLKTQLNRAADVGALANEAVAELAEVRSEVSALRDEARENVRLAQEAAARQAARVFSGATAGAPRWLMLSGRADGSDIPEPPGGRVRRSFGTKRPQPHCIMVGWMPGSGEPDAAGETAAMASRTWMATSDERRAMSDE